MKTSLLFAVAFAGITLFSATKNAWTVPVFAALTFYWAVLPYATWQRLGESTVLRLMFVRLALVAYATAWFFALVIARPSKGAFWLVFCGVLAIASPVVLLAGRSIFREPTPRGGKT